MTKEEKEAKSREEKRLQHQKNVAELFGIINTHRDNLNKIKIRTKNDGTLYASTLSAITKELSGYDIEFTVDRYYVNCKLKKATFDIYIGSDNISIDELPALTSDDILRRIELVESYKKRISDLEKIVALEKDGLRYYGIHM